MTVERTESPLSQVDPPSHMAMTDPVRGTSGCQSTMPRIIWEGEEKEVNQWARIFPGL